MRILYHPLKRKCFYTEWTTTTSNETITLPLVNGSNYNFIAWWGDGSHSIITAYNDAKRIHTYVSAGTYTVKICGQCEGWSFNNGGDKLKINKVWGGDGFIFKNISAAFNGCSNLTVANIPDWDVSSSTTLNSLFYNCSKLITIDVSNWDTSNVTSFYGSFYKCKLITNVDVSGWNVSKSTTFEYMFTDCISLTSLDLNNWTFNAVSNINFKSVFSGTVTLTTIGADLSGWNTTKFTTLASCFSGSGITSLDCDGWVVSNVTAFTSMFSGANKLTSLNLNNWTFSSTSNIDFLGVFFNASALTTIGSDLSGWNTTKFTTLSTTFYGCGALTSLDCGGWDTQNVTSFYATFYNCISMSNPDVSGWNVSKGTSFRQTFTNCHFTSLDLKDWIFSTVSNFDFYGTFSGCAWLTSITSTDLSGWDTTKCTTFNSMFSGCSALTSLDCDHWVVSNSTSFTSMLQSCTSLTSLNLNSWTFNTVSDFVLNQMFMYDANLTTIGSDLSGWNLTKCTNCSLMFYGCTDLTSLTGASGWDVSSVTTFNNIFYNCNSLATINISGWDMSKVTAANTTQNMFMNCSSFTALSVPSSLTHVDTNFATGCSALTVYNFYRATAPTISGTPFGNYAKPLHIPASNFGYDVAPWTNSAVFSSVTADL